jgi:hypothetical protein
VELRARRRVGGDGVYVETIAEALSERGLLPSLRMRDPPGRANETRTIDFKAEPADDPFEIAKDVAAFANAEGGTILIGAKGKGEYLASYEPMTTTKASEVQRSYNNAVKSRCRPDPFFNVVGLPKDDGVVLAVNVSPFPGATRRCRGEAGEGEVRQGRDPTRGALPLPDQGWGADRLHPPGADADVH